MPSALRRNQYAPAARGVRLCGLFLTIFAAGCVCRDDHRISRIWADYNTLKAPALYLEEVDHLPYHAARIEHYRWMYNAGPGKRKFAGVIQPAGGLMPAGAREIAPQFPPPVPPPEEMEAPIETPGQQPPAPLPPLPTEKPANVDPLDDAPLTAPIPVPKAPIPLPKSPPLNPSSNKGPTASHGGLFRPAGF